MKIVKMIFSFLQCDVKSDHQNEDQLKYYSRRFSFTLQINSVVTSLSDLDL